MKYLLLCSIVLLSACDGTATPNHVESAAISPDSTTPKQYSPVNNGFIGYYDDMGWVLHRAPHPGYFGVITDAKRLEYDTLIDKYGIQFKNVHAVTLIHDEGITPWTDPAGNKLWAIDLTHLQYLADLDQWKRDQRPGDSIWSKALNAL